MVMEYTSFDTDITKLGIELTVGVPSNVAINGQQRQPDNFVSIQFQFPPVVTSDTVKVNWTETPNRGQDPVIAYTTSDQREFGLEWTYYVDGGMWTIDKITTQLRAIRGYAAAIRRNDDPQPSAKIRIYRIGGVSPMSCRLNNINIKYATTYIKDTRTQADIFPIFATVTTDIKLWTQGSLQNGNGPNQRVPNLKNSITPDWY